MTVALEIKNVSHKFGEFTALDDVSLNINSGDFTVLLGLNGLIVKSHGNADHIGIEAAVRLAIRLTTNNFSHNLSSNLSDPKISND